MNKDLVNNETSLIVSWKELFLVQNYPRMAYEVMEMRNYASSCMIEQKVDQCQTAQRRQSLILDLWCHQLQAEEDCRQYVEFSWHSKHTSPIQQIRAPFLINKRVRNNRFDHQKFKANCMSMNKIKNIMRHGMLLLILGCSRLGFTLVTKQWVRSVRRQVMAEYLSEFLTFNFCFPLNTEITINKKFI